MITIQQLEKATIGEEKNNIGIKEISKKSLIKGNWFLNIFRDLFMSKFSLMINIIDYSGNQKFYYLKPKRDCFKLDGVVYVIFDKCIKKTNTKYNIITYNEGNPTPRILEHESNELITSRQLKNFMDSEIVDMILRYKPKPKFDFMIILIIGAVALVGILILLHLLGIIDIVGFFMPMSS